MSCFEQEAQLKFTELQWKLQDEMKKMLSLVKQTHPDEQQVKLTQLRGKPLSK